MPFFTSQSMYLLYLFRSEEMFVQFNWTGELLAQSLIREDTLDDSPIGPLRGTLHLALCVERQTSMVYIKELPCPLVSGWLWPLRGHGRRREIRRLS